MKGADWKFFFTKNQFLYHTLYYVIRARFLLKQFNMSKFVIDSTSPYYVHPSEGSGTTITEVVFEGNNYDLREKAVMTALRSKNKLGFITGTLTLKETADPAEVQAWDMVNSTICSWLLNIIDPKIRPP